MSIKFEDYGSMPEWARTPNIVSETRVPLSVICGNRCSHCNNIIKPGESHNPVRDLYIPGRGGSYKTKQCMLTRSQ